MRRTETPKPIWIKFCMVVDMPDIVTCTNYGDHRLRGFWVAGVKFPPLPLTFIFALTTLSHYRARVIVNCISSQQNYVSVECITGCALTATGFVNGRWQFSTPTESTRLDRSPKNLLLVITSATPTAVPNLVQIRLRGASGQMGEI